MSNPNLPPSDHNGFKMTCPICGDDNCNGLRHEDKNDPHYAKLHPESVPMTEFHIAVVPNAQKIRVITDMVQKWYSNDPVLRQLINPPGMDMAKTAIERQRMVKAEVERIVDGEYKDCVIYRNNRYQVHVRKLGKAPALIHLSIKRIDKQVIHDWRDLQEIKNAIVGKEYEGVELYPAESRRVDAANQFHIWVVDDPKFRWPFGFKERAVSDSSIGGSVNRPLPAAARFYMKTESGDRYATFDLSSGRPFLTPAKSLAYCWDDKARCEEQRELYERHLKTPLVITEEP